MSEPVDPASLRPPQAAALSDDTLEELNRLWAVVRAFSNTAHDVNNALQVIAGNAELLEARDLDPAIRKRIEAIRGESGKAAATVNRLLEFARARRQPVQRHDLAIAVEAATRMRLASLGRSRVALTVRSEPGAPAIVAGEAAKLHQILLNLLLAAEERVAGRPRARIEISIGVEDRQVVLRVAASAAAPAVLPPDASASAYTSDSLTRDTQLWAAAHLAAAQGGTMTIDGETVMIVWK